MLRSGLPLRRAVGVALAADTLSILTMELVDNGVVLAVPGAMDAGLADLLFWGSLTLSLVIAFVVTVPVNRALIRRGRGHAVVPPCTAEPYGYGIRVPPAVSLALRSAECQGDRRAEVRRAR